jgi:hypothetical protein
MDAMKCVKFTCRLTADEHLLLISWAEREL